MTLPQLSKIAELEQAGYVQVAVSSICGAQTFMVSPEGKKVIVKGDGSVEVKNESS